MDDTSQLKVVTLTRLCTPFPPVNFYMAESPEIQILWEKHLKENPMSDPRTSGDKRKPIQYLNPKQLQYDVQEGESVIFIDADNNKIVGVVVQNMIGDEEIVKNFNGLVFSHLNKANYMRVEDPGLMSSVGYTAGSRSAPDFGWAKNIKKPEDLENHVYKLSCMFAHVWQVASQVLPKEILVDYEKAIMKLDNIGMDGGALGKGGKVLRYSMKVGGVEKKFETSNLAPPSGSVARNYCRHTHKETNLNDYAVSYTTSRTLGCEFGGNFYIADYGIRIAGRADQLVAWRGADYHGTTLPKVDPLDKEPEFNQSGLAYILPARLPIALQKTKSKWRRADGMEDVKEDGEEEESGASVSRVKLDDSHVKPDPRETMPKRDRKEGTGKTVYKKNQVVSYAFPKSHAYKDMSKVQLLSELDSRIGKGRNIEFCRWWVKPKLMYTLLTDDGVGVPVTYSDPVHDEKQNEGMAKDAGEFDQGEVEDEDNLASCEGEES